MVFEVCDCLYQFFRISFRMAWPICRGLEAKTISEEKLEVNVDSIENVIVFSHDQANHDRNLK